MKERGKIVSWVFILTAIIAFVFMAFPRTDEVEAVFNPPKVETVTYYNVPLDYKLQNYIRELCDEYNVDMPLVLAIIGQESNYDPNATGDNEQSQGLMQIQQKWHSERMHKLGVTDLMNPRQNVTVGIDLLAELISEEKGWEWAVTAYNAGIEKADFNRDMGVLSEYTQSVMKLREMIQNGQ
ncbi:MAG: lytic transglycosylase domain-containing protein [Firmicutes bacterium]|jgi:soluble lytic murein transglycosylase-like protein|nr:lytic transglycosylase domain-containing protein [Bacillota bacterium]